MKKLETVRSAADIGMSARTLIEINTPEYAEMVGKLFNWQDNLAVNFTHAVLGIYTEVAELEKCSKHIEWVDEAGDLIFYERALQKCVTHYLKQASAVDFYTVSDLYRDSKNISELVYNAYPETHILSNYGQAEVLDVCKKWIGYGKVPTGDNLNDVLASLYSLIDDALYKAALGHGVHGALSAVPDVRDFLIEAQNGNVKKLSTRYKGGSFNAAEAINPDKVAEHRAIQGDLA